MFKVILGSFSALGRKLSVTRKGKFDLVVLKVISRSFGAFVAKRVRWNSCVMFQLPYIKHYCQVHNLLLLILAPVDCVMSLWHEHPSSSVNSGSRKPSIASELCQTSPELSFQGYFEISLLPSMGNVIYLLQGCVTFKHEYWGVNRIIRVNLALLAFFDRVNRAHTMAWAEMKSNLK